jgi:hypothetical protein
LPAAAGLVCGWVLAYQRYCRLPPSAIIEPALDPNDPLPQQNLRIAALGGMESIASRERC